MDLSLTEADREHLARLGVTAAADGSLRAASGRPVSAGTAVQLLAKSAISPADFAWPPLREGHAAASVSEWITGIPERPTPVGGLAPAARTGPAGLLGHAGSGTADADMPAGRMDLSGGSGDQIDPDLSGDGDDLAKGMLPSYFMRGYLTAGHQSDSPANLGHYGVTPEPGDMGVRPGGEPRVAEPQQFGRGPLTASHEATPPANDPGGNNPHPPPPRWSRRWPSWRNQRGWRN